METLTIDFGHGLRLKVPAGVSVLEAALDEGIEIAHARDGHGERSSSGAGPPRWS